MKSSDSQPLITVIGSINMDVVCRVGRLPKPGETVTDGQLSYASGGKGANQAVAATRSGARVQFIARAGDDEHGKTLRNKLLAEGIMLYPEVSTADQPTGTALILVDDHAENAIAVAPGANDALRPEDIDARSDWIAASDYLLIQMETPPQTVAHALDVARRLGTPAALNYAPTRGLVVELSDAVGLLIVNASEAAELAGLPGVDLASADVAADRLLGRGLGALAITLGAQGVFIASAKSRSVIHGLPIQPVDTTGAGDTFSGAIVSELARGQPLADAARYACAAAALTCLGLGAQAAIPTREQVAAFLQE